MKLIHINTVLCIAILLLLPGSSTSAQVGPEGSWTVAITVVGALPLGSFGDYSTPGFGLETRVGYMTGANLLVSGRTGFIRFGGQGLDLPGVKISLPTPSTSVIPIVAGVTYFFPSSDGLRPSVGIESGVFVLRSALSILGFSVGGSDRRLGVTPHGGVHLKGGGTNHIPLEVQFTEIFNRNLSTRWMAVRGGVGFVIQ